MNMGVEYSEYGLPGRRLRIDAAARASIFSGLRTTLAAVGPSRPSAGCGGALLDSASALPSAPPPSWKSVRAVPLNASRGERPSASSSPAQGGCIVSDALQCPRKVRVCGLGRVDGGPLGPSKEWTSLDFPHPVAAKSPLFGFGGTWCSPGVGGERVASGGAWRHAPCLERWATRRGRVEAPRPRLCPRAPHGAAASCRTVI